MESSLVRVQPWGSRPLYRRGAEEARGAHNSEVVRSKRTAGTPRLKMKTCVYRRGAEEARGAHNSEVVRSKRTAGTPRLKMKTCVYRRGAEEARGAHNPEAVRSKRTAGTPRHKTRVSSSPLTPRNFPHVRKASVRECWPNPPSPWNRRWFESSLGVQDRFTGVAQRKRAGLITPRPYDRNVPPVLQDTRPESPQAPSPPVIFPM
jgi:hypothetical protein